MRRALGTLLALALLVIGCSSGQTVQKDVPDAGPGPGDSVAPEETVDVPEQPDTLPVEDTVPDLQFDTGPDQIEPSCLPGEGCFLDPCDENPDCQSGWCVEHMGDQVCTMPCIEECPDGWSCKAIGTDPDVVWICISRHANLCKPCNAGADCLSVAGSQDACIAYGEEGAFCGGLCTVDADCPWGFSCGETQTVDGVSTKQCVADAGICPCTETSVKLGLWTACVAENEFGVCEGQRICTDAGLSACDAPQPAAESCNGLDDDCDGFTDEPDEVEGSLIHLCDDGNPCTQDKCLGEAGCDHEVLSGTECMDGDPCTVGDHCEEGECVGQFVDCDDGNPCTEDFCNPAGGCAHEDNTEPCDDSDPCTVNDTCSGGSCSGFAVACDCQADADCAALEDGNLCNGTLYCNLDSLPYECQVKPGTEVPCEPVQGEASICIENLCNPLSGACELVPRNDGFACNDGDACTMGDQCAQGECTPGTPLSCNDGNPCTDDSCDPSEGCSFVANELPCNDGDACTTGDTCTAGACLGGPALVCDDGNACNGIESCVPATGCKTGTPLTCDDGDLCNGTESCDPLTGCKAGKPLECDDGNICTTDSCDPTKGCVHSNSNEVCDDGNACTEGDQCANGKCQPGAAVVCDDDNLCTTDSCEPKSGCVFKMNQAPCDDGNLCTTGDHCHLGECISSGTLACNDNNLCTDDSCNPKSGCLFVNNDVPCDDGNACTQEDHCAAGWCKAGALLSCNDGNLCTDDLCDPQTGCLFVNNALPCDDANACTLGDLCANGACQPGAETPDCDDDNLCTDDSCNPQSGCVNAPNTVACDDGSACTTDDQCADGQCVPGPALDCDDSNPCTTDGCNAETGCTHLPLPDQTPCGANHICTDGQCVEEVVHGSQSFTFTGSQQTFVVPGGVSTITVVAYGAQGGVGQKSGAAGKGGRVQANLAVTPGQTLYLNVGGRGKDSKTYTGGWNGGGTGGPEDCGNYGGGGGGGASDVLTGGTSLTDRILVAGGGGGSGADGNDGSALYGGHGGATIGGNGQPSKGAPGCDASGHGGTQSAGGAQGVWACSGCNAQPGTFGNGGNGNTTSGCGGCTGGGGGGGGWYGGGGGGHGGGGGGSSYAGNGTSSVTHDQGVRSGDGEITLTW